MSDIGTVYSTMIRKILSGRQNLSILASGAGISRMDAPRAVANDIEKTPSRTYSMDYELNGKSAERSLFMDLHFIGETVATQLTLGLEIAGNCAQRAVGAVHRQFRSYRPNDLTVAWQVPSDVLPPDHLARFVCDITGKLDLSEIINDYSDGRGQPPYDPLLMTRLYMYCRMKGIRSSEKAHEATYEDMGCRMLTNDQHPKKSTIHNFFKRHLTALANLFDQSVKLCEAAGLVDLKNVAVDGSKVKANASLHHAMSYDHMCKKEAQYEKEIPEIKAEIQELCKQEASVTRDYKLAELSKDLRIRQKKLPVILESKAALEEAARRAAESNQSEQPTRKNGKRRKKPSGKPEPKSQRNFTDPESRVMPCKKGWVQGYNAQVAADGKAQVIVGHDVVQATNDKQELLPMARQLHQRFGCLPENLMADCGFFSADVVGSSEWDGLGPTNLFIPPGKEEKGRKHAAPIGRIPKDISVADRMARKLKTKSGHAIYALRKCIVEPVFGQIKNGVLSFAEFHLRKLAQVKQEFAAICAVHNLIKLYHHGWNPGASTS